MLQHTINLDDVTYIAVDGRENPKYAKILVIYAEYAAKYINFNKIKILTPIKQPPHPYIEFITIPKLTLVEYSKFIVNDLIHYVDTNYCILYQWDGCISHPEYWTDDFLKYDYIGAPWYFGPHVIDMVGNGGFSLRSKKLLQATAKLEFDGTGEDLFICYVKRNLLMKNGIKFSDLQTALRFSVEWPKNDEHNFDNCFGFHLLKHMQGKKLYKDFKQFIKNSLNLNDELGW